MAHGELNYEELNYEEVLQKVNSESTTETIAKKVEQDKITKLEEWMEENEIYSWKRLC